MPIHPIAPVFNEYSEILILGSFPSVRSRETGFYYGHPQNRFWKIMKEIYSWPFLPETNAEKRQLLLESHVALWDVVASCDITGSSDTSIRNVISNDLTCITDASSIQRIYCNGSTAIRLYMKHIFPSFPIQPILLPSSSPANASYTLEKLTEIWMSAVRQ